MKTGICSWCNAGAGETQGKYCAVCGREFQDAGRQREMRYKTIRLNENGKALVCPHCENEELTPGDYCKICGNNIINRCADMPDKKVPNLTARGCDTILQGNARYCSKCGNESTFFQKGWLCDWRSENVKKAIRNASGKDGEREKTINFSDIKEEKAE